MPTRILLILNTELSLTRQIFHGISEFTRTRPEWELQLASFRHPEPMPDPIAVGAGGVIGHVTDAGAAERMSRLGVPWVNVSNFPFEPRWPVVTNDDERVGELAARSLLERGFRYFAYSMRPGGGRSFMLRGLGFIRAVERGGGQWWASPSAFTNSPDADGRVGLPEDVGGWLESLLKPVAVLAANDDWGELVIEQCRARGLAVPEQVAVVGVDNDDIHCELAPVPLSSVALGTRQIGFEAAALLDRLMNGGRPPPEPVLIEPVGLVVRRSSDVTAVADADVAAAVRFIADHAADPIDVDDVADAVALSRRALERRFRAALGRTPHDEIQRAHVDRACQLLRETALSLPAVAKAAGFRSRERMSHTFRQRTGQTPAAYRRRNAAR